MAPVLAKVAAFALPGHIRPRIRQDHDPVAGGADRVGGAAGRPVVAADVHLAGGCLEAVGLAGAALRSPNRMII